MNPSRTSYGRTNSRLSNLLLLVMVTFLATGCAAPRPQMSSTVVSATTPVSPPHSLTTHNPAETRANSSAWNDHAPNKGFADTAPVKAKDAPVTRECPKDNERVLLIGDSLSAGFSPHVGKLARNCGTKFFAHSVIGSHVTQWTNPSWLASQLLRAKPTVVMVSLGGNDFVRNDPQNVERAIKKFVTTVRNSGARLLWISPPAMPFKDKVGARSMWQNSIDGDVHIDWYPMEQLVIPRANDRVHPTIPEYRKLSVTLWQWMATVTHQA